MRLFALSDMRQDGLKMGGEVEQNLFHLSAGEKKKIFVPKTNSHTDFIQGAKCNQ